MKAIFNYFWLALLLLLIIHGASIVQNEWQIESVHDHGKIVEIKIEELNCSNGIITSHFESIAFQKKIDARTCALLNVGQKIRLKHSRQYPDTFLFVNEQSPNRFILGGLEITLGLIGLLSNWPMIRRRRVVYKNFPHFSDN
jgi:hypothetical protein